MRVCGALTAQVARSARSERLVLEIAYRALRSSLRVGSPASRSVGGSVTLDTSHLELGIAHDHQELGQRSTHVVDMIRLVPTEVKILELTVVRQPLYPDQQRKPGIRASSTAVVRQRRFCTLLGHFESVLCLNSNINACNNAPIQPPILPASGFRPASESQTREG